MIGILTFHAAHNYGSNLQAYALQTKIALMGYENQIINYQPQQQKMMYAMIDTGKLSAASILKSACNLLHYSKFSKRKKMFEAFICDRMNKSSEGYLSEDQAVEAAQQYHTIVCGSDQIWNRNKGTRDKSWIFYLDFPHNCHSISYAPSMGNGLVFEDENKQLELISKFDCVSVREVQLSDYLIQKGISAQAVVDPTLLLSQKEWDKVVGKCPVKKPYILFYSINCDRKAATQVKRLAKQMRLPVVCPMWHPRLWGMGFQYCAAGPMEFLTLVKNADFVYTNSFHGTVFATIFEKDFVSSMPRGQHDNRRESFLNAVGLQDHIVFTDESLDSKNYRTQLNKEKMKECVESSESFLYRSLERFEK